ncbi:MAG: hypothetical protein CFH43_00190 [Proteobacteria bacterium]|nr:MAG: hypothetical protein CFH43_00190 [Pseudomonadota bacterium]
MLTVRAVSQSITKIKRPPKGDLLKVLQCVVWQERVTFKE